MPIPCISRLLRDDLKNMSATHSVCQSAKAVVCLVFLIGWGFSLLNISATFINEEVYLGTVVLIGPLALKGTWANFERIL